MKESPVDTLRNSYILCDALRKNWGSGLLKENILLDEKTGLELGYWASPCARTSASTVAVVCDSKNEEFWSGNLSEPTPATLRLWDLGTNSRASPEIHYKSLSYDTHCSCLLLWSSTRWLWPDYGVHLLCNYELNTISIYTLNEDK